MNAALKRRDGLSTLGRPWIGGDFLDITRAGYNRYQLRRWKLVSAARSEPRRIDVRELSAETLIHDLLFMVKQLKLDAEQNNIHIAWDHHGLDGQQKSLRDLLLELTGTLPQVKKDKREITLTKRRPERWHNGNMTTSEWDIYNGLTKVASVWETGFGWCYTMEQSTQSRRGHRGLQTLSEVLVEIKSELTRVEMMEQVR